MGQRWDQFLTGLGTQAAPFGFAPGVDPKTAGMNVIGGIGANMLSNITKNPLEAFGGAYKQQMEDSRDQSRDALSAKVVMDQMEEKKRERAKEQELEAQFEQYVSGLPPDQQSLARFNKDAFIKSKIETTMGGSGGNEVYGTPQWYEKPDGTMGFGVITKGGGFNEMQPPEGSNWLDPRELQTEKAGGKLSGDAPRYVVDAYVKNIRPEMESTVEAINSIQQAKSFLSRGIQTGSAAEIAQAARGWGQALGIDVDERMLADTQAYQNFIGQVVIPRMKELGGNDSNEEMRKLYGLSGGDITQTAEALKTTLDYTEKLMRKKLKSKRQYENLAIPYLSGMQGVMEPPEFSVPSAPSGEPDFSTMSDQELEDYVNGR